MDSLSKSAIALPRPFRHYRTSDFFLVGAVAAIASAAIVLVFAL